MRALATRVGRDEAWHRLHRRRIGQIVAALFGRRPRDMAAVGQQGSAALELPKLEAIWLPQFLVTIEMRDDAFVTKCDVVVDAQEGRARLADLSRAEWLSDARDQPDGKLTRAEAESQARECVVKALLSRPGWGKRPAIQRIAACELIGYPVWAYYFANRAGMLDARLLDAVTGNPGGPGLKMSLLATLTARQQS